MNNQTLDEAGRGERGDPVTTDPSSSSPMMTEPEIDAAIAHLESEMRYLQAGHPGVFAFANAWAVRHDALLAATPAELRPAVEQRLHRIGIRWGVAHGVRMTGQFPAFKP